MGARFQRARRALEVGRVARPSGLLRVLREIGVIGQRPATREGAREFRRALEELGTTYVKLGQLPSSRPDLLPRLHRRARQARGRGAPVTFAELEPAIREDLGEGVFADAPVEDHPHARRALVGVGSHFKKERNGEADG